MEKIASDLYIFSIVGNYLQLALVVLACLLTISAVSIFFRSKEIFKNFDSLVLISINIVFVAGFLWICWFHYKIYNQLPLELPENLVSWLNQQLELMNRKAAYGLPLYESLDPPRYAIPVWIENEKYYFWYMCFALLALFSHFRISNRPFRAAIHILLACHIAILFIYTDPFTDPLPRFFAEITPWFDEKFSAMDRLGHFMRLYPKMIFYYNAEYMWLHPPMLFLAYGSITVTFVTSSFMLFKRDIIIERLGYDAAKFGYLMLTLGMLLGYPWALKAWGPNWWWDPKICSSIMMWAIFSTFLHTRLYANKRSMWYFSSILGILCFVAMIFTFITSFYFPGEHTFQ